MQSSAMQGLIPKDLTIHIVAGDCNTGNFKSSASAIPPPGRRATILYCFSPTSAQARLAHFLSLLALLRSVIAPMIAGKSVSSPQFCGA